MSPKIHERTPDLSREDPSKLAVSLKGGCMEWKQEV